MQSCEHYTAKKLRSITVACYALKQFFEHRFMSCYYLNRPLYLIKRM